MKNVLIFTIEGDLTSTLVGDIIKYYFKSNPLRINGGDGLDFISYDLGKDEFFFVAHGRYYSINDIHSVWYRKNVNGFNVSDSELIGIEKIKTELGETELFEKNLRSNVIANRKDLFAIF